MGEESGYVKRPLLLVGATVFVALWLLTNFGQKYFFITVPIALSAIGIGMIFVHKKGALALVLTFLTVATAFLCYYRAEKEFLSVSDMIKGNDRLVIGEVYEKQSYRYGSRCVVKLKSVENIETHCKMSVYFRNIAPEELETFEKVEFRADISDINSKNVLDKNSLKSEGIFFTGKCYQKYVVTGKSDEKGILHAINKLRKKICETVTDFIPNDNGKLITALTLGEKGELSFGVKHGFRVCGLSHIMAVSGLHVYTWAHTLFVGLISFLSKRKAAIVSAIFTIFFIALTGFTPSVVRAGILMIFIFSGYVFFKAPDSLNSLGASILLMCFVEPFVVNNVSFLLSFSAVFGLSLMSGKIETIEKHFKRFRKLGGFLRFLCRSLAICVTVTLFSLPVTVFTFGKISLINIVSNVLCVSVSMFVMVLGAIGSLLAVLGFTRFIGLPILLFAGILSKLIIAIVTVLSRFDFLYLNIDFIQVKICVGVLLVAAALVFLYKPDLYKNKTILLLAAVNLTFVSVLAVGTFSLIRG